MAVSGRAQPRARVRTNASSDPRRRYGRTRPTAPPVADDEVLGSAAARALTILEAVSRAGEPASAIDLAPRLKLPKATVHRLMQLLERIGFLQREPGSKRFIVGERLAQLSLETLVNMPKKAERRVILQSLVEEVQETCNVTVLVGADVVYIDRVECQWPLRTHFRIGSRVPIHCGASGKLFLSMMPAAKRSRILRGAPLRRYTEKTVLDPDLIERELRKIRSSKIGIDVEEFVHGLIGLAVPVFDARGRICATVSMHVPTSRVTAESVLAFVPALRRAAKGVSATL